MLMTATTVVQVLQDLFFLKSFIVCFILLVITPLKSLDGYPTDTTVGDLQRLQRVYHTGAWLCDSGGGD